MNFPFSGGLESAGYAVAAQGGGITNLRTNITSLMNKRPRDNNEAVSSMLAALPRGDNAGSGAFGAGFQDESQSSFAPRPFDVLTKQFKDFPTGYAKGTTTFVSLKDNMTLSPGVHTLADVPMINYFLESNALTKKQMPLRSVVAQKQLRKHVAMSSRYIADTPSELMEKWSRPLFVYSRGQTIGEGMVAQNVNRNPKYSLNITGQHTLLNMFGTTKPGTHLFFLVRKFALEDVNDFLMPDGTVELKQTEVDEPVLQVRGMTSEDAPRPVRDSSVSDIASFQENYIGFRTAETDQNFYDRVSLGAKVYTITDYDEATGQLYERNVAEESGIQEALANMPDFLCEQYELGEVLPVGTALEHSNVNSTNVLRGHRVREALNHLPLVNTILAKERFLAM